MIVKLTYFRPSGKYYDESQYETSEKSDLAGTNPPIYRIFIEVARLRSERRLPGLREGHGDYAVAIDVPDHPHRHPHLLQCPEHE
jgi:hypothetical protein